MRKPNRTRMIEYRQHQYNRRHYYKLCIIDLASRCCMQDREEVIILIAETYLDLINEKIWPKSQKLPPEPLLPENTEDIELDKAIAKINTAFRRQV